MGRTKRKKETVKELEGWEEGRGEIRKDKVGEEWR